MCGGPCSGAIKPGSYAGLIVVDDDILGVDFYAIAEPRVPVVLLAVHIVGPETSLE